MGLVVPFSVRKGLKTYLSIMTLFTSYISNPMQFGKSVSLKTNLLVLIFWGECYSFYNVTIAEL